MRAQKVGIPLWIACALAAFLLEYPMLLALLAGGLTGRFAPGASVRLGLIVGFWLGAVSWAASVVVYTLASYSPWGGGLWVNPARPDYWGVIVVMALFATASAAITWALGRNRRAP